LPVGEVNGVNTVFHVNKDSILLGVTVLGEQYNNFPKVQITSGTVRHALLGDPLLLVRVLVEVS
jgi:hypothetical protein